jgi:WD40 repeat protein
VLVAGGNNCKDGCLVNAELYDPAKGKWTNTGSMVTARTWHTATLLPNGKVLVAGGDKFHDCNDVYIANAELYDPVKGTWTGTGSMGDARIWHTATLLPNGKVLVAGGQKGTVYTNILATAELYDPVTGIWTRTGSMSASREHHTATLLPNGKVLVTGESFDSTTDSELYDPATGTWAPTGAMKNTRGCGHVATLLSNGKVFVTGGQGGGGLEGPRFVTTSELYDPATGKWADTDTLSKERISPTATLLPNGKVLVTAGLYGCEELYDPVAGTWKRTAAMKQDRLNCTATLLPSGKVLIAGGFNGCSLESAELYDFGDERPEKAQRNQPDRANHPAQLQQLPN